MNSITKIMIADDHALFADGLEQIVDSLEGFTVVGKATDGKMLMQKLNTVVPDIILMDINMPYLNGMEAAQKIMSLYPQVKILFISMYYNTQLIVQAKEAKAFGFIMKDVTASVLKEAIVNAKNGVHTFLAPASLEVAERIMNDTDPFLLHYKLSPRETDIIRLIKEGNTTKQIAAALELSIFTVETHRKNINRKLKVQSTAELIAFMHKFDI
ncbi:response regulator transcription factor [Elizabethkingia meningoseptica]|uniref:response regulator transcription factor n=1 Tax=Elizabethkingia meningoseptica TaxID=238 RepID=UPI0022F1C299|nr:response regulator transcription factor [Elizabethkingia meningoseptica]EJK5327556.1 response regulator transcription factor [Elizabethkingia meningoseptica]MDE5467191.1 response regulator transcription factor [Elizabethkingia meningoseptica]MDE5473579.1 response regulator transcription factor [Elizabethkingia meningoseptica]MDE5477012.1 response regulator transcription factor [Elizabethkingia meningoseptica]MDE5484510.1 response regulator transcription factor [Elizabethkingia meningoseptic